jgi:hypothetical protein
VLESIEQISDNDVIRKRLGKLEVHTAVNSAGIKHVEGMLDHLALVRLGWKTSLRRLEPFRIP